jgi:RNA polymerase sigma factor (sigma-70 family)
MAVENSFATPVLNDKQKALDPEFERIFREFHGFVYRTAYGVTGRPEDAEDVAQTVFLRLFRQGITLDIQRNLKAYFYRAAFNTALSVLRSRRRRRALDHDVKALPGAEAVADSEISDELHRQLEEAMECLTPQSSQILVLRYVHGCDLAEIARIVGTTRSTVAVSLFRSRVRLKKIIRANLKASEKNHETS